jgi:hypothetical protein
MAGGGLGPGGGGSSCCGGVGALLLVGERGGITGGACGCTVTEGLWALVLGPGIGVAGRELEGVPRLSRELDGLAEDVC